MEEKKREDIRKLEEERELNVKKCEEDIRRRERERELEVQKGKRTSGEERWRSRGGRENWKKRKEMISENWRRKEN